MWMIRNTAMRLAALGAATLLLGSPSRATQMPCADAVLGSAGHDATATVTAVGLGVVGVSNGPGTRLVAGPLVCLTVSGGGGATGNCDDDPVINGADLECLLACLDGPVLAVSLDCLIFDFDNDGNVDMQDVAQFMMLYEG